MLKQKPMKRDYGRKTPPLYFIVTLRSWTQSYMNLSMDIYATVLICDTKDCLSVLTPIAYEKIMQEVNRVSKCPTLSMKHKLLQACLGEFRICGLNSEGALSV